MDQDVSVIQKTKEGLNALRTFKVQGNGFFTAIEQVKIERITMPKGRPHVPGIITTLTFFDLQDFCTQVRQDRTSKGCGQDLAQFDDPNSIQGQCWVGLR